MSTGSSCPGNGEGNKEPSPSPRAQGGSPARGGGPTDRRHPEGLGAVGARHTRANRGGLPGTRVPCIQLPARVPKLPSALPGVPRADTTAKGSGELPPTTSGDTQSCGIGSSPHPQLRQYIRPFARGPRRADRVSEDVSVTAVEGGPPDNGLCEERSGAWPGRRPGPAE